MMGETEGESTGGSKSITCVEGGWAWDERLQRSLKTGCGRRAREKTREKLMP